MQASNVSSALRRAGFGIVSTRRREGIRCTRGAQQGHVNVTVDLDRPMEQARIADALAEWLGENAPRLKWVWSHSGDGHFVLKPAKQHTPDDEEVDGAPYGAHLVTDPYDSGTNRLMEMDLQAQREAQEPKPRSVRTQRKLNDKAQQHTFSVRVAMADICTAVYDGRPPRQQDVDKARQQLDALVTLAQDWSR